MEELLYKVGRICSVNSEWMDRESLDGPREIGLVLRKRDIGSAERGTAEIPCFVDVGRGGIWVVGEEGLRSCFFDCFD